MSKNKTRVANTLRNFPLRGVEMNDRTYDKRFSIETLSEEFKPLFLFDALNCNFLLHSFYEKKVE